MEAVGTAFGQHSVQKALAEGKTNAIATRTASKTWFGRFIAVRCYSTSGDMESA